MQERVSTLYKDVYVRLRSERERIVHVKSLSEIESGRERESERERRQGSLE